MSAPELARRIKEDMRRRFDEGERPTALEYLDEHPELRGEHERVLSLLYEEYCLLEEVGSMPDPDQFCDRYAPWRDSLVSQLRYHRELSRALNEPRRPTRFPKVGERFLRYQLDSELGRGGQGRVFLARHESLGGKRIALKLTPDQGEEASLQGRLDHAHIVPVVGVETDPATNLRALSMLYFAGQPLDVVIRRIHAQPARARTAEALWEVLGPALEDEREVEDAGRPAWSGFPRKGPFEDACAWVGLKVAEALAHAHRHGVMHRDVKPANVLLTRRGGPMLLDFNLAQRLDSASEAKAAATGGTLPYMSPEQLRAFLDPTGWSRVGAAADLYSLGLVIRELLTGERPRVPDPSLPNTRAIAELLDRRESAGFPPARSINPKVPHALQAILDRCLAPHADHRYQDASALIDDLTRYLDRRALYHARNPSRRERAVNFIRRNRLHHVAAAALAVGLAGAGLQRWTLDRAQEAQVAAHGSLFAYHLDTGSQAARRGKYPRALERYEAARALMPGDHRPYQGMATVLVQQGKHDEALERITQAIELAQAARVEIHDRAELYLGRARIHLDLGARNQARMSALYTSNDNQKSPESDRANGDAEQAYRNAIQDLVVAREFLAEGPSANLSLLFVIARTGLGDAASYREEHERSLSEYRSSEEHAIVAHASAPSDWSDRDRLEAYDRIVKERIAQARADLNMSR